VEAFANSILMDAPMAIVGIDESGLVCCSNAKADRFFGRPLEGVDIAELIEDFDVAALKSPSGIAKVNALSRNLGSEFHWRVPRVEGGRAHVDLQAAQFFNDGRRFITLFIRDMTAHVAAEVALQDLRLQITYNWRLNSLGEVASMVAHELSQPLSAATNFLAAANSALGRPEPNRTDLEGLVSSARGQIDRAADIIRGIRSLMTHEKGFQTRENISEVVGEIMPILKLHARETNAKISAVLDPVDFAHCDRVQLQQLVINLVRNAMDAPANGVQRRVEVSGSQTLQGYRMTISDNGPGVPSDMADRLFQPLASSKPGGMGLGLSICRTIVQAHGGDIDLVPSALGGAAFAFTLNVQSDGLDSSGGAGRRLRPVNDRNLAKMVRPKPANRPLVATGRHRRSA